MYINFKNGKFTCEAEGSGAIAQVAAPQYFTADGVCRSLTQRAEGEFADEIFSVNYAVKTVSENLFKVTQTWQNNSPDEVKFQTVFSLDGLFGAEDYCIPCVSFNGNEFGNGGEPKGLTKDGKPWIFSYDRESIPACTVTENKNFALALFSSFEDEISMCSACSVQKKAENYRQQIIHPEKEAPYTYCDRDKYSEEMNEYFTLGSGEKICTSVYIYAAAPKWEHFGITGLLDELLDSININCALPDSEETKKIWQHSVAFARSLITDCHGKKGFIIGLVPTENGYVYRDDDCFELAWCGQNIMLSRLLIEDYVKFGHEENLHDGVEIVDNWVNGCVSSAGLISDQLRAHMDVEHGRTDICNMSYGVYEVVRVYKLLKSIGIEKPEYLAAAEKVCDFLVRDFNTENGFAKAYSLSGEHLSEGGTVGAFAILPLCELYSICNKNEYLTTAKAAMEFYCARDLDKFTCSAGALDTCCVDKETSAPLIAAGIMLNDLTGEKKYLEYAEKAAYYFVSWMYHYSPAYLEDDDISQLGINLVGYTAVSAQHHHLDDYGLMVVPHLYRLAELLGDDRWAKRADMLLSAGLQNISDGTTEIHGLVRPEGSKNEAVFQCHWGSTGFTVPKQVDRIRGGVNDWLVAWPCAFRMEAIRRKI